MSAFTVAVEQLEQDFYTVDDFELDSAIHLKDVTVAYKTWGKLNEKGDNVMIICHAFTGSANVEDWRVYARTLNSIARLN
jgi:homoserine O-acetyltransferase